MWSYNRALSRCLSMKLLAQSVGVFPSVSCRYIDLYFQVVDNFYLDFSGMGLLQSMMPKRRPIRSVI